MFIEYPDTVDENSCTARHIIVKLYSTVNKEKITAFFQRENYKTIYESSRIC